MEFHLKEKQMEGEDLIVGMRSQSLIFVKNVSLISIY